MRSYKLRTVYKLVVLSVIVLIISCQAPPDENNNVVKPPDWIYHNEFKEYPEDRYFVSIGVSDRSFEEARSRSFEDISKMISESFLDIMIPWGDEEIVKNFNKYSSYKDFEQYEEKNEQRHIRFDNRYNYIFNSMLGILLDHTKQDFENSRHLSETVLPSWVELNTVEQKRYTSGFVYFVLMTFNIQESYKSINFEAIAEKNKQLLSESKNEEDFYNALKNMFFQIERTQQSYFWTISQLSKKDNELTNKEKKDLVNATLAEKISFEEHVDEIFKDFDIKFSADNIKAWRDKYSDKIDIQIFWKKKLIKIPLRFETSTDAQVELFKSAKDDVSYEMRVMPLSVSNRIDNSGQYYIEFNFKPESLRFAKLINFALTRRFCFTLPAKRNSFFDIDVNLKMKEPTSKTKVMFNENIRKSLKTNLEAWCKNNDYKVNEPTQTQQTRARVNRYNFQLSVDIEDLDILENNGKKMLRSELILKLNYFDDSLEKPRWVRLKQDRFVYNSDISDVESADIFKLYCTTMILNVDFNRVLSDMVERAFK